MSNINRLLFFLIIIFVFLDFSLFKKEKQLSISKPTTNQSQDTLGSQTNDEGDVVVIVKPKVLQVGKKPVFEMKLDTHSIDLSFDVAKQSVLTDDKNNVYSQSVWDGSPPGGHHREGTLTFDSTLGQISSAKLIIKNIAGVKERKFNWNL